MHGYEIGGVEAALTFVESHAPALVRDFDLVVYPCINPIAFQFNMRWNLEAQDTNRHFCRDPKLTESGRPAFECVAYMDSVDELGVEFLLDHDCHETTQRDLELRQAKIFRDGGTGTVNTVIPQGFYLVMNEGDEGSAIGPRTIDSVRKATKIADEDIILGVENRCGVVYLDCRKYPGLCMNYSKARHRVTTEVYPDIISPQEACAAQIAAINAAIGYVREEA